ncbi:carboxypeptidase [Candidatus Poribacteria bacterium]|mgnify:CR=1 FL=1|jgi:murein tripeptide amidase MpaA|nr:carboxypeptidase [Candidatus Poribacteria bacterium]MBT5533656.1 carboxypeptidase [Candidatus Poribacteria bacterium]MBT7101584.1 carboxypeptidase [Candidatus Poribacteria bacterium]MBT7809656.1 carboxypeptidase [Candidatus Poribacteria bacterium]
MDAPRFDKYYRYDEMVALLEQFAAEYPTLAQVEVIGQSHEGRDIPALTVTNADTGAALSKPALYIDANIHGSEVTACSSCLYIAWRLLNGYADDAEIAAMLDTTAFYLIPMVSPDGVEHCLSTPGRVRSGTRLYPHEEEKDGLYPDDVDGDGRILQMRIEDPSGGWKVSEHDDRLMIPREFHDADGPFYRVYSEGSIRNFDGVEVRGAPSKQGLDFNRNFPSNWRIQSQQGGAGDWPFSEPETRAIAEFVKAHPNIGGMHSFHTGFEAIIRVPCSEGDDDIPREDVARLLDIGNYGKERTGYAMFSYNELYKNIYEAYGDFATWAYHHLGLLYYCDELWDMRARGNPDPMDVNRMEKERDAAGLEQMHLDMLRWADENMEEDGFIRWTPFDHPQLGPVELGGWRPLLGNNSPFECLEETCRNIHDFTFAHAKSLPRISATVHETESLGDGVWRVSVAVVNGGYLPTSITRRAVDLGVAKPVTATISLPDGAEVVSGAEKQELGHLAGYGGRKKAEWIVRLGETATCDVEIHSEKGGARSVHVACEA